MHTPSAVSSRAKDKLSNLKVKAFAAHGATGTGKKLSDGGGMYLTITPAGSAIWRIKYRFNGAERTYTVGAYPGVTLEAARAERDAVKALLRDGRDPVQARKVERAENEAAAGNTFEELTTAWLEKERRGWSEIHYTKSKQALERDVLPELGKLPVRDITPLMVTGVIETIVKRGVRDTAAKILQHVTGIFRFAQSRGLRNDNPALPAREALPRAKAAKGRPALLEWAQLGDVLRRAEGANLSRAVRMAHRLCAFTVARISNVVEAEWSEFTLEADVPLWIIPRSKMKARDRHHDHKVVLCPKIAEELREWREITGGKGHLFRSPAGGAFITRESLEKAYRVTLSLKNKHTPHGWRAAFATLARDQDEGGFPREVVELTLDHIHDNEVARAYDRGERLKQRVKLMTWWGTRLAHAQHGADVVKLKGAA